MTVEQARLRLGKKGHPISQRTYERWMSRINDGEFGDPLVEMRDDAGQIVVTDDLFERLREVRETIRAARQRHAAAARSHIGRNPGDGVSGSDDVPEPAPHLDERGDSGGAAGAAAGENPDPGGGQEDDRDEDNPRAETIGTRVGRWLRENAEV